MYLSVHNAAKRSGWELKRARSVEQSLHTLDTFPARLVIYDWTPEDDDWRSAIDRLSTRPEHPCILLASRVIDEYLWAELVTHGGFDVIHRSADPEQVIRAVRFVIAQRNRARKPHTLMLSPLRPLTGYFPGSGYRGGNTDFRLFESRRRYADNGRCDAPSDCCHNRG